MRVERFEAWLSDNGIAIVGQAATGSGDLVRYDLRLPGGEQFEVVFSLQELVSRPEEAIGRVEEIIRRGVGHGRANGT